MADTRFAETEALLAVMTDDEERLLQLLDGMLPGERRTLARHADRLAAAIRCGYLADDHG